MEKINFKSKRLIEENFNLVNTVANFMMIRFNGIINRDDLVEFGIGGLIDAAVLSSIRQKMITLGYMR
jgi:hypothetical protein